jgi:AcrR family transcriptional regulator
MPQAARTPRRRDFERNRRRILSAARRVLAERGPEALTVSEVADRAGLNRTTAYQHFRKRDALAAAVMRELADEVTGMLREPRPVWGHVDQMVSWFLVHPELARLTLHQLISEKSLPEPAWSTYRAHVRKIAHSRRAQRGVDAEMLSHLLLCVGVLWPLVARRRYDDLESARKATARFTRELRRLLIRGVMKPEAWPELERT